MARKNYKYLFIAKLDNRWILRVRGNNKNKLEKLRNNFMASAYLLDVTETKIVRPEDIKNYGELGWENDMQLILI